MRVSRIEITGYRGLARVATSIDGPLTAFVGFNEAGKTSLLNSLSWFSNGGALAAVDRNRSRPPASDNSPVVKLYFDLDDDDKAAFDDVVISNPPSTLILYRKPDGNRIWMLRPRPTRPAEPFVKAHERLTIARTRLASQLAAAEEQPEAPEQRVPADWMDAGSARRTVVRSPGVSGSFVDRWLRVTPEGRKNPRDLRLAGLLDSVLVLVMAEDPNDVIWERLSVRELRFVQFGDDDRTLQTSYEMVSDQRGALDPAVGRLLGLAEIDLDVMWSHIENADSTKRETLLERGNDALRKFSTRRGIKSKQSDGPVQRQRHAARGAGQRIGW